MSIAIGQRRVVGLSFGSPLAAGAAGVLSVCVLLAAAAAGCRRGCVMLLSYLKHSPAHSDLLLVHAADSGAGAPPVKHARGARRLERKLQGARRGVHEVDAAAEESCAPPQAAAVRRQVAKQLMLVP